MRKFAAALFATLMLFLVLRWQSAGLVTSATPNGILALEFCDDLASLEKILAAWDLHTARWAVIIDFAFIIAFGLVFYYGTTMIDRRLRRSFSRFMTWFSLAAPLLDVVENLLMLLTLYGVQDNLILQVTYWAATLKFAAAGAVVLYLLVSLLLVYGISKKASISR